jgi:transposase-like protein
MKKIVRQYTEEFRQQALNLAKDLGSVVEASKQLGISSANIYSWKNRATGAPSAVQAERKPSLSNSDLVSENEQLRRENSQLKKVNYILKSAAAFFSQDHLK